MKFECPICGTFVQRPALVRYTCSACGRECGAPEASPDRSVDWVFASFGGAIPSELFAVGETALFDRRVELILASLDDVVAAMSLDVVARKPRCVRAAEEEADEPGVPLDEAADPQTVHRHSSFATPWAAVESKETTP